MDWDNDGDLDILSGCYWTDKTNEGQIQILRGDGELNFAAAESIANSEGDTLCNTELPEDARQDYDLRNICTQQHAVDYDSDGDLDLVTGCFGSEFFYFENTAAEDTPDFDRYGVKLEVNNPAGHSNPQLVDWDGDGDLDLLSGTAAGGAFLSENTGTRAEPQWADFKQLMPASTKREQLSDDPAPAGPAQATRVWATDWNDDGLLDLVIGDAVTIVSRKEGLSATEFEKRRAEYDRQMDELSKKQQQLVQSFGEDFDYENIKEEQQAKLDEANEKWRELYDSRKEFMTSESTGHVWLLIQKPKTASADQVASDS